MHRGKSKVYLFIGVGCIAIALLGYGIESYGQNRLLASLQSMEQQARAFDGNTEDDREAAVTKDKSEKDVEDNAEDNRDGSRKDSTGLTEPVEAGELIGKLEIPSISLEAAIREGAGQASLKDAIGHLRGTAPLGDATGNCCIAGHRNYSFGRYFNRLNEVQEGDVVVVTDSEGVEYTYTVFATSVVEPEDISVLEPVEGGELTLITCTPLFIATHRLIVSCRLAET